MEYIYLLRYTQMIQDFPLQEVKVYHDYDVAITDALKMRDCGGMERIELQKQRKENNGVYEVCEIIFSWS